ncbi:MAG TPA: hypothetical protein VEH30_04250 [Terriglobales bacterium]|nr:hypothetical protein [Terriglobales bacterium]
MKTALLVASLLCTTAALGQAINGAVATPTMANEYQMITHEQHATAQHVAQEHSLLDGLNSVSVAEGELPLWEVAPKDPPYVPLGDTARMLRKEHESVKKAQFVFEN